MNNHGPALFLHDFLSALCQVTALRVTKVQHFSPSVASQHLLSLQVQPKALSTHRVSHLPTSGTAAMARRGADATRPEAVVSALG